MSFLEHFTPLLGVAVTGIFTPNQRGSLHMFIDLEHEREAVEARAGDGHHIAHATDDPLNEQGGYRPVSAIHKLDERKAWTASETGDRFNVGF